MKRRNPQALAAWGRKGGPHGGSRRPARAAQDEIDEALEEMYAEEEEFVCSVTQRRCVCKDGACVFGKAAQVNLRRAGRVGANARFMVMRALTAEVAK